MMFPVLQIALFATSLTVLIIMIIVIRFTRAGILLRAATDDRGMVALLGTDSARIFTVVVATGSFLAGLAGGLVAPFGNVNYLMDTGIIVDAFIVCVIGGLGNRSEEHTSELPSLMRISYAVFCLKNQTQPHTIIH